MANGDAASAQGFTPVLPTDDFRLGYDGINRAADFAANRSRHFGTVASTAAMNALPAPRRGDRCWRSDETPNREWTYYAAWAPTVNAGGLADIFDPSVGTGYDGGNNAWARFDRLFLVSLSLYNGSGVAKNGQWGVLKPAFRPVFGMNVTGEGYDQGADNGGTVGIGTDGTIVQRSVYNDINGDGRLNAIRISWTMMVQGSGV